MYDQSIKQFIRKPHVKAIRANHRLNRVRVKIDVFTYDLEVEEALAFANRLVDAAERFDNEA